MTKRRFGIGIVGLQPGRSWAALAHIPALRSLPGDFKIIGVANSSVKSARTAVAAMGIERAFAGVSELVAAPDVDIVSVTVKVPHHLDIVKAAIDAGKHVCCEWPLGNGLAEAEILAGLARTKGVLGVVGTQALLAPEIVQLQRLIDEGFIGRLLSTTIVARGGGWGGSIPVQQTGAYLLDNANGATMLTIPLGHTLAALRHVLCDPVEIASVLATRRPQQIALDTGEWLPMTAPDQILVSGLLAGGAPVSIHYRGGAARDGNGFVWDINGTEGDLRVTGASGHAQMVKLALAGGRTDDAMLKPIAVPEALSAGWPDDPVVGNVARLYAQMAADLRDGTRCAPSFDDAAATHRIIAAIEKSAHEGRRAILT